MEAESSGIRSADMSRWRFASLFFGILVVVQLLFGLMVPVTYDTVHVETAEAVNDETVETVEGGHELPARTLSFDVCGGLTNQRVAIIEGLMVAQLTRRAVVLPLLNGDGTQTGPLYTEQNWVPVPFSSFFDVNQTSAALMSLGVQVIDDGESLAAPEALEGDESVALTVKHRQKSPAWYAAQRARELRLDCTFLALNISNDAALEELYWRVDNALTFASPIASAASRVVSDLHASSLALGGGGAFTALHFRNEPDWVEHCVRWEASAPRTQARMLYAASPLCNQRANVTSPPDPIPAPSRVRGQLPHAHGKPQRCVRNRGRATILARVRSRRRACRTARKHSRA